MYQRTKLFIMSCLTALCIKLFNKYLMMFYFSEFEKMQGETGSYSELIDYIQEKLTDGSEVNIILNKEMAEGTFGITFDNEEDDELEEFEDKKLH